MAVGEKNSSRKITIHGLVQGVGFRPFIYRLALRHNLKGWVENRNDAVYLTVQGSRHNLDSFISRIPLDKPAIAHLDNIEVEETSEDHFSRFEIRWSRDQGEEVTEISPDIAVCQDCLQDMNNQPRRKNYPFTNCTNCGPRFSIIKDLPYDRVNTTMQAFNLCEDCEREYHDIEDRRFHAQPVACNHCGPTYELLRGNKEKLIEIGSILSEMAKIIDKEGIIIAKGLGGFFLACDALNEMAVNKLRRIKKRYSKPFAVMFRDTDSLKEFARLSPAEEQVLNSWQRPVVILDSLKPLAPSVSLGFPTIGVLMPYLPFHYLLFEHLNTPAMVFTSGNFSEEPILIDDVKTFTIFGERVDAVLVNNRPIHNRVDDSVAHVVNDDLHLLRRSRGYVPSPVFLKEKTEGLLAAGAELVNCFCIGKDHRAILSQHIGDLKNFETLEFYEESFSRFLHLFRVEPRAIACDLHPDYLSTRYARSLELPVLAVQHHHAHIASCMAEYGLDEKVIGISMDGTGLGTDGNIWGSEFMVCDLNGFERISHFEYKPMPGGDLAVEKPWRMAVAYLYNITGPDIGRYQLPFKEKIPDQELALVIQSIQKGINSPLTCGAGRLFDAVASLLGLLTESGFHAEAPMRLEAIAAGNIESDYDYSTGEVIGFDPMFGEILDDLKNGTAISEISARFHNTVIKAIIDSALRIRGSTGISKVVLSGGTFQNKYLLSRLENRLKDFNFNFYCQKQIPTNDGGIALGQLAVLAKKQKELCV